MQPATSQGPSTAQAKKRLVAKPSTVRQTNSFLARFLQRKHSSLGRGDLKPLLPHTKVGATNDGKPVKTAQIPSAVRLCFTYFVVLPKSIRPNESTIKPDPYGTNCCLPFRLPSTQRAPTLHSAQRLRPWDAHELGDHQANPGQHSNPSMLQLRLPTRRTAAKEGKTTRVRHPGCVRGATGTGLRDEEAMKRRPATKWGKAPTEKAEMSHQTWLSEEVAELGVGGGRWLRS